MNYETTHTLSASKFKRRFGVQRATFQRMVKGVKALIPEWPHPGRPPKLSIEDQILVALEYWREYRTYFHIATDKGVSESTVCRIVLDTQFRIYVGDRRLLKVNHHNRCKQLIGSEVIQVTTTLGKVAGGVDLSP